MALWAAFQVAACDMEATFEPSPSTSQDTIQNTPPPSTGIELTRIVGALAPGDSVTLQGANLDKIEWLVVDGVEVDFLVRSPAEIAFRMPELRECDVDRRPIEIVANDSVRIEGPLHVRTAIRLEVGESRILSSEDLSCLQISGGVEDYLLTVASLTPQKVWDMTMRLRSVSATSSARSAVAPVRLVEEHRLDAVGHGWSSDLLLARSRARQAEGAMASARVPFDDYAGAQVGDTLEFVDWSSVQSLLAKSREEAVTYRAVVVAATKGQLVVVDLRSPEAGNLLQPSVRERLQKAAEIADRYMWSAVRAIINPDLEIPNGAGGRIVHILTPLDGITAGSPLIADIDPDFALGSDMFVTLLNTKLATYSPEIVAGTMIHEAAHLADALPEMRGTGPRSAGWYSEAIATVVQDMAALMAMGQEKQASVDVATVREGVPSSELIGLPAQSSSRLSPWGNQENSGLNFAAYDRGGRILRHAIERLGLYRFAPQGPTLHQRLMAKAPRSSRYGSSEEVLAAWGIEAIAREVGIPVEDLLRESMLANLTDDLIAADAVKRFAIPQIESWDNTPRNSGKYMVPSINLIKRDVDLLVDVEVAGGAFAYWYIPGDARGLSLQASNIDLKAYHEVRLMRLR